MFLQAKNYRKGRTASVRLIVVHDMEIADTDTTAESCAQMFHTTSRDASAHYCVDNHSVVQCVNEADTAYAAPPCNSDGIHIEHAGFAANSGTTWANPYNKAMFAVSGKLAHDIATRHNIPIKHLTNAELKAGQRGFVGHVQITQVYGQSTHTDPGPGFPWTDYMQAVATAGQSEVEVPDMDWGEQHKYTAADAKNLGDPKREGEAYGLGVILRGYTPAYYNLRREIAAQFGALNATIAALAGAIKAGGSLTAEQAQAAAKTGAQAALAELGQDLTGQLDDTPSS